MNSNWQKAKEIFAAGVEIEPANRGKFLDEACGGDASLRRDIESLLAADDVANSFLAESAISEVADVLARPAMFEKGRLFGQYEIAELIGAGGMGEVYLALDTRLNRQVALKFLSISVSGDENRFRRFEREALAVSALNHPNILTIYELGAEDQIPFIATEFVKGETLAKRLKRGELGLKEILEVTEQTAFALATAHRAGIIHRDIKPENIMLRDDGIVKVLDFGLAKPIKPNQSGAPGSSLLGSGIGMNVLSLEKTNASGVLGTVAYMSPEQAHGKEIDARSDIWGLGVMVYEMLTRRLPFAGKTVNETIRAIREREPEDLGESGPPELKRIVMKALEKDAGQRYQTITDFLLDVKNLKRELEFGEESERSVIPHSVEASEVAANPSNEHVKTTLRAANQATNGSLSQNSSAEYIVGEVKKHKLVSLAILTLVSLVLSTAGYFSFFSKRTASFDSIAVLPLVNVSGDKETEFLSDGISETLINNFTKIPALRIMARSTAFRYKGKEIEPRQIGRELDVHAVLTGRVLQQGDFLSIQIDLIDAADGSQIWGNSYNGKAAEILDLQQLIARRF